MRRWFCVIVLLLGFTGDGYAWTVRPRAPVAIERGIDTFEGRPGAAPTGAWWRPA
jgi:hypothetical protein